MAKMDHDGKAHKKCNRKKIYYSFSIVFVITIHRHQLHFHLRLRLLMLILLFYYIAGQPFSTFYSVNKEKFSMEYVSHSLKCSSSYHIILVFGHTNNFVFSKNEKKRKNIKETE